MLASLILYFDQYETAVQGLSAIIEYPKQVATECAPLIAVFLIGGGIAVWAGVKIWSRALSIKCRELAKPVIVDQ